MPGARPLSWAHLLCAAGCLLAVPAAASTGASCLPSLRVQHVLAQQLPALGRVAGVGAIGERDVAALLSVLAPVDQPGLAGPLIEQRLRDAELRPDRAAVLIDALTAALIAMHARETLDELESFELPPDANARLGRSLRHLLSCIPQLFAERTGGASLEEAITRIRPYRTELEALLLGKGRDPLSLSSGRPTPLGGATRPPVRGGVIDRLLPRSGGPP